MPTVSLSFLLIIGAIAAATGVLGFITPNPIYGMAALLLALYAVHGLGLRLALREQDDPREILRLCADLKAELDRARAKLEAEQAERAVMERQWIG